VVAAASTGLFDRAANVRAQRIAIPVMIVIVINALRFFEILFSFNFLIIGFVVEGQLNLLSDLPAFRFRY
jgi:hypothetical protein